jgi:glycosyltransferase involved in cell wall biosynthesis
MVIDGETGILVPAGDIKALATAIRELALNVSKRESMGRNGRLRIERHFSLETMIREYESLYLQSARTGHVMRLAAERGVAQ